MKKVALTLLALLSVSLVFSMKTHAAQDCATRHAAISEELRYAEANNNYSRINGLRSALAELDTHCTRSNVISDTQRQLDKLNDKVADKQKSIREIEFDLQRARADGDAKKIRKYQRKLEDKQEELAEAQEELARVRNEMSALRK
ncbi:MULTISPECIES: DUF1090 domain-containing protein [Enterobacterales]|jgi:flagellar biosynthesis chaperone FliJ|uniref:DUF1090 domain-containing protein n=1 Tax=Enterobacterales TaxID=91347 RepID=UPI00077B8793|nr:MULTISPECIES: DUF1090 domain-containing protein [Enterobacterales]MBB3305986.1 flagellar biosynthesis chaperone FliJ [Enterobacter sp. Sphag1F]MDY0927646.1 DUF1090 domain-containing protein [Enterobacter sp. CFBP8995]NYI14666.1 flagellar biosynthesis chaperone FliJ [Enterobacter sp. Sphag71]